MSKRQSLNKTLLQLDQLSQAQQWHEARPLAEALAEQAPTTPGVIERAVLVLRQLEDWPALTQLLLQARNQYQLWPQGSDLLMGQGMVELAQWSKAIPYLELALEQEASAGWAHHFLWARRCGTAAAWRRCWTCSAKPARSCRSSPGHRLKPASY